LTSFGRDRSALEKYSAEAKYRNTLNHDLSTLPLQSIKSRLQTGAAGGFRHRKLDAALISAAERRVFRSYSRPALIRKAP
jgi:hypothetical protein